MNELNRSRCGLAGPSCLECLVCFLFEKTTSPHRLPKDRRTAVAGRASGNLTILRDNVYVLLNIQLSQSEQSELKSGLAAAGGRCGQAGRKKLTMVN